MAANKLNSSFYIRDDIVQISRELIGKVLCSKIGDDPTTCGMIIETEAYCGRNDKACHANNGLRTERTEIIYQKGGLAYVYLCYGIHHLFNVVTNIKDTADAVLIRAIKPLDGNQVMTRRREAEDISPSLTAGPGRLTQALGITTAHTGVDLAGNKIWIEDRDITFNLKEITTSPRIGVDYAEEDAKRPWRFYLTGSAWVSK